MFPFLLPSFSDPKSSMTLWNAASSHQTVFIMLVVAAIFLQLILICGAWVCQLLWGKVTAADVTDKLTA